MATFLDLQDEVLNHGFDATTYRARVKNWLNEAAHRVARQLELRDMRARYEFTTSIGTASYSLPSNFVRMESVTNETGWGALQWVSDQSDLDDITETGDPQYYSLSDSGLTLWPVPSTVTTIQIVYYGNPVALSSDSDTSPLPVDYHDVLVSYALSKAFRAEDDYEASQFFRLEFDRDLAHLGADRQYESLGTKQIAGTWPTDGNV